MRIVCAPDSFKECMSAADAAAAMARGIRSVDPSAECVEIPMADGGEGTAAALVSALGGTWVTGRCHDALGRELQGRVGWVSDRSLAILEVAEAVGLERIAPAERDVWRASSRGVGELLRLALDAGAAEIIVGLGGSATNDAGSGMLAELGVQLLDAQGAPVGDGPRGLQDLARADLSGLDPRLRQVRIRLASDVSNPLLGPGGATATYGPQKGAQADDLEALDAALRRWADVTEAACGFEVRNAPGAGAAGGLSAGFLSLGATIEPGVDLVLRAVGFGERLAGADWVFTGEGRIDQQTAAGKTPWGVARAAAERGVPSVLFGGQVTPDADALLGEAVRAVVPITARLTDLPTALAEGPANLERAAATATRLLLQQAERTHVVRV